eukprot:jgi/Mesvir1/14369/Mv09770-RA.2
MASGMFVWPGPPQTASMSVVGNFVAASALAHVGWSEAATFFLATGFAFQMVVFVSLFQHPYIDRLVPSKLYPVFFLLIAPPTSAANALALVNGAYTQGPRMLLFLGIFIYMMLALRIRVWISIGFSLSWWAYTFPMASAGLAVGAYATEIDHGPTRGIALALCGISSLAVVICLGLTVRQALFSKHMLQLFPPEEVLFLGWDDRDVLLRSHAYLLAVVMEGLEPPPNKVKGSRRFQSVVVVGAGHAGTDGQHGGGLSPSIEWSGQELKGSMDSRGDQFYSMGVDRGVESNDPLTPHCNWAQFSHVVIDASGGREAANGANEAKDLPTSVAGCTMPEVVNIELREIPEESGLGQPGSQPPVFPVRP